MAAESVPLSVPFDGNLRITAVASADNPLSAAVLAAGDDLTYSLKTFTRTVSEAVVSDPRLTLKQVLQLPGKVTETVEVQYVFGDTSDTAETTLVEGTSLFLTCRYSVPNETAWTAAQVADVITVKCGIKRKDAPVENGVQTITQTLYVTAVTKLDAAIVA